MSIDQLGIHIGPLYIRFYALVLIGAAVFAAWVVAWRARNRGLDPNHVWDGLFWALIPALIGARIYHILTPSPSLGTSYYVENPLRIFEVWNGGLGIYGALVGGFIGARFYARRHKQPILQWLDLIAPAVAFGQAIGRWGNFINQELFGAPTTLPWAVVIPPERRPIGFEQFSTFHPLFLYESLWSLAAGIILIWASNRFRDWLRDGDITVLYLMQYAVIRFLLDFLRLDSHLSGALTTAQLVSLATFVIGAGVLVWRHWRSPVTATTAKSPQKPAQSL